jgi:pyruvate dehydrogenase E1 component beta subunit
MAKLNMVQALNLALEQEMAKDPTVLCMGEDVGYDGGVFRVTDGLVHKFGEARVIDTPLAESGIVGTAIGMAMGGLKPVAEMQFCGFSYIAIPQLEAHASRLRSRSHGKFTVPMVLRIPYGGGVRALEHHSEARETLFTHQPGLKVVACSTPRNARALLVAAIRDPDPVVFFEPKHSYRAWKEEVPDEEEVVEIGKAHVDREGDALTVVAWGSMIPSCRKAIEAVEAKRGIKIELIDLLTLKPLDHGTIVKSVTKTGRAVVVSEAPYSGGLHSEIIAIINDKALMYLQAPVKRVTYPDVVTAYFARELLYIPQFEDIVKGIEDTLDF